MAYFAMAIFAASLFAVLWHNDDKYMSMMIVALVSLVGTTVGFYFNSSSGSEKKSDAIFSDSATKSAALAVSAPIVPPPGKIATEPSIASTVAVSGLSPTATPSEVAAAVEAKLKAASP